MSLLRYGRTRARDCVVAGLAFITVAGLYLYKQQRLLGSLPLVVPWLLYPVITQGDQLIDNLTINQMRLVCQVLLALLFGAPVLGALFSFAQGCVLGRLVAFIDHPLRGDSDGSVKVVDTNGKVLGEQDGETGAAGRRHHAANAADSARLPMGDLPPEP